MHKLNKLSLLKKKFSISLSSLQKFKFSSQDLTMPVIDIEKFVNKSEGWEKECKITAECLHDTGILVVRDPVRMN